MIKFPKPKEVSFRSEMPLISNTGYYTHSLFFHPAKFIPQVVVFCLNKYFKENSKILDPFGGSGTVNLEASILGHDSYLVDINPILSLLFEIKFPRFNSNKLDKYYDDSVEVLKKIFNNQSDNKRDWSGLKYWYPEILFEYFSNVWNNYHTLRDPVIKSIIGLTLFKISKKYSYAEHNMPKLFTSKRKRKWIEDFLCNKNYSDIIIRDSFKELKNIYQIIESTLSNVQLKGKITYFAGSDSYTFDYNSIPILDGIITSPPYLQAQEYIRTFKMELLWLGYSNKEINHYKNLEIPFRKTEGVVEGEYINSLRNKISDKKLLNLFDSYFWFTLKSLEKSCERLKNGGRMCIFIGNPVMNGYTIEIWKTIYEYFITNLNFKLIDIYDDKIVNRKLFNGRKNKNPNGMKSEFMLILEK